MLSGEGAGDLFEIDERNGDIRMLKGLDREEKAFYVLQAQAVNRHSNQPEEPQSEFIITVQDINDNGPQFHNEPYMASVPEMCPTGKAVVVWLLSVNSTTTELNTRRGFLHALLSIQLQIYRCDLQRLTPLPPDNRKLNYVMGICD